MALANLSGYSVGGSGATSGTAASDEEPEREGLWSHAKLKRAYLDYLGTKRAEIDEQQDARRFRHGSQWTAQQIEQLNLRKQPVTFNNKTARKINGIVGTLERLKQDPKAYPRTPKHEEGSELATAALRYALDAQDWSAKDPLCAEMAGVDGIGGLEFNLIEGDHGDREIEIDGIFIDSFFYDPRSFRHDFSDARYMGVGKWLDLDAAIEILPDHEEELEEALESGSELSSESDREHVWFMSDSEVKRLRLVECWYRAKGDWYWAIFTGTSILEEGKSPFINEKNKTECKYEMFSAYIDQDGDRYGFVRDLKPLQQQINMRESKALFTMISRRLIAEQGAFDDVEVARREAARADGVVIKNKGFEAEFDDTARLAETEAQFKFLENVKSDFESFGPNVAVTGQGLENSSGRAIHLLQQAGLADLGPFIQSYRGWKIRVYRKMWNAIQHHWTGERWIRVTDDDDVSQFIQVNGVQVDPMTGMPTLVNALGSLDVDIILDEGPDTVNQMGDAYDTLSVLASKGSQIPPAILIELSPLQMSVKTKLLEMLSPQQPDPETQMRKQLEVRNAQATIRETEANATLKKAQAMKAMTEASAPPEQNGQMEFPGLTQAEIAEKIARAHDAHASATKKEAETQKVIQDIQLEPRRMMMEQANTERTMMQQAQDSDRNAKINEMKAKQRPNENRNRRG